MKIRVVCLSLLWGGSLAKGASAALSQLNDAVAAAPVVPGAYIVELDDNQDVNSFYGDLSAGDMDVEPRLDLSYSLFKGCSFRLKNVSDDQAVADAAAQRILEMPKVRKIWPVRVRNVPKDEVIWVGNGAATGSTRRKRRESGDDTFSPHIMTQVDKLRAEGITGAGVRIGIVDTGVDYHHPALGNGCFGPGCLFSYGADLVGDDFTGRNTPVPDSDPYDNCAGHGTHVAGIIAAQTNELGFTGAAPDVSLGMYRVFGCNGGSSDDVLIAAFNQAYEDGSDIITASISGPSGWSEDPWAVAVQRIVEAGVPCTVSAGNDGSNGLFFASSAANGKGVTAVASVENTEIPLLLIGANFTVDNTTAEVFGWEAGNPAYTNVTLPLWAVTNNTEVEDDACSPLPDGTPDLSSYMVLIRQGNCGFDFQAQNVAAKGAKYIIIYSNSPRTRPVYVAYVEEILGAGMATDKQGAEWIGLLNQGKEVIVHITDQNHTSKIVEYTPATEYSGLLSSFSSWGPTWEVDVNPQMATPGGNILSTYPLNLGGYAVISGTSMACPLMAAVYALVSQARGTLDPSTLERVLSSTAKPKAWAEDASGRLAPVAQQGAGLIQAFEAAYATTVLSIASISFNDTDNFIPSVNFSIQNLGPDDATYELGHVEAITMYTFKKDRVYPAFYPNPTVDAYATLEFSDSKVTIPAGGSADITVTPTPPSGLDETLLPVYGGYITINGMNGNSLSLPYLGVVGSMHSAPKMFDPDWTFLANYTDSSLNPLPENQTFVIPLPDNSSRDPDSSVGYPTALIQLNVGTPLLRCDVVALDASSNATTTDTPRAQIIGSVLNYPIEYSQRTYYISPFTGMLADGTVVPGGRYAFLVRVLRIFGDPEKEEDYDTTRLVPFSVVYI